MFTMKETDQNKKRRSAAENHHIITQEKASSLKLESNGKIDPFKIPLINGCSIELTPPHSEDEKDSPPATNGDIPNGEIANGNTSDNSEDSTTEETAPPIILTQCKTNLFERNPEFLVTVYLYIKMIRKSTLNIKFEPKRITAIFSSTDPKLLSQHEGANSDSLFQWSVELKGVIVPEKCTFKVTASVLEMKLKKAVEEAWESLSPIVIQKTLSRPAKPKNDVDRLTIPLPPPPPPAKQSEEGKECVASARKSSYSDYIPFGRSREEIAPGMTGLDNIGNTCFMNSVLQCLLNTVEFRDYFIDGKHVDELNGDNPLGMGGHLANAFGSLVQTMWSREHESFSPSKLKSVMSMRATQFSGYAQHDAQEFMVELLDGIHEDLNRIKKKPYTSEPPDLGNWPEREAADEAWRLHKLRNDSIVDDLFKGQFKSTLECLSCNKISVKFDEFRCLSVPIPKESKIIKVVFFWRDITRKPTFYRVCVPSNAVKEDLVEKLEELTDISSHCIEVLLPLNSRSFKKFPPKTTLGVFTDSDEMMAFEMLSPQEAGEEVVRLVVTQRLVVPKFPSECASCGRKAASNMVMRRCTKCLRVCYCDLSCQKNHWTEHKNNCSVQPEPVGWPFITSVAKSKVTYSNLCTLLESYARFTVDIFQPPMSRDRKRSTDSSPERSTDSDKMEVDSVASDDMSESPLDEDSESSAVNDDKLNDNLNDSESLSDKPTQTRLFCILPQTNKTSNQPELEDDGDNPLDVNDYDELCMEWQTGSRRAVCYVQTKEIDVHTDNTVPTRTHYKVDLNSCIDLFTQPERLSEEDSWKCPRCNKPVTAIKEMNLWRLPQILVIQLKRFAFRHYIFSDKIDKMIEYPIRGLDLTSFLSTENMEQTATYDLYGVVNHMGRVLGGHYNAFCRTLDPMNPDVPDIDWRLCDDRRVKMVSDSNVVHSQAYLLVYRRRDTPPSDAVNDPSQGACGSKL